MPKPNRETIGACKLALQCARCELDESKTLEEAKRRVDEIAWLTGAAESLAR